MALTIPDTEENRKLIEEYTNASKRPSSVIHEGQSISKNISRKQHEEKILNELQENLKKYKVTLKELQGKKDKIIFSSEAYSICRLI